MLCLSYCTASNLFFGPVVYPPRQPNIRTTKRTHYGDDGEELLLVLCVFLVSPTARRRNATARERDDGDIKQHLMVRNELFRKMLDERQCQDPGQVQRFFIAFPTLMSTLQMFRSRRPLP